MNTGNIDKENLLFYRFARLFMILLFVVMAVGAVYSFFHAYLFGADKVNGVFFFIPLFIACHSFLILRKINREILSLKNISLEEERKECK